MAEVKVPLLAPEGLKDLHFGNVQWEFPYTDVHNLFHINRLESFVDKAKLPLPPHRKTVYDLIFLTKGSSVRSKGLSEFEFKAGQFFFLPAFQITAHSSMSKDAEGYYIHFDNEVFKGSTYERQIEKFSFLQFLSHPIVTIPPDEIYPILNIFQRLEKLSSQPEINIPLISHYIITLLTEVSQFSESEQSMPKNASTILVQKYKEALSQFIYQKQNVADYAEYLHVTPNHLNKCVKKITNKSSQDLLNEMLILEAKSLIKYSNLDIAEIAVNLRDQTPSNFSRFFKKMTGIMPSQFK